MINVIDSRRLYSAIAVLLLSCTLGACGGGGGGDTGQTSDTSGSGNTSSDSETSTTPAPAPPPASPTATANLSWSTPGVRENGDKLYPYELGGYQIRYRMAGETEYQSVTINDGEATQYQLSDLESGTYEIMISTFDTEGVYSDYSPAQTVVLN